MLDERFLLLMACGATKTDTPGFVEAWDRYDGPMYRDLRAWRAGGRVLPRILILSAAYQLIDCRELIPNYDLKLTPKMAERIRDNRHNKNLFQSAITKADRTLSVAGADYDNIYYLWKKPGQSYEREPGGIGLKRQAMMRFLRDVAQHSASPVAA